MPSPGAFSHSRISFSTGASQPSLEMLRTGLCSCPDGQHPPEPKSTSRSRWDWRRARVCAGSVGVTVWAARPAPAALRRTVRPGSIGPRVCGSCWSRCGWEQWSCRPGGTHACTLRDCNFAGAGLKLQPFCRDPPNASQSQDLWSTLLLSRRLHQC